MARDVAVEVNNLSLNIGIPEPERREIADGLIRVLADTFTLYLKTHNFHWNVTGRMFPQLHSMFEDQYTELWQSTDELAERVRALGFAVPASLRDYASLTSIPEEQGTPGAEEMIRQLVEGQGIVIRTARLALPAAERGSDQATMDLLARRLAAHEKAAWMLRSIME